MTKKFFDKLYPYLYSIYYCSNQAILLGLLIGLGFFIKTVLFTILVQVLLFFLFRYFLKSNLKATFFLFIFSFWFINYGSLAQLADAIEFRFKDFLLLLIQLVLLWVLFRYLKKHDLSSRITAFAKWFVVILLLTVPFNYYLHHLQGKKTTAQREQIVPGSKIEKPDIFLIIADEYTSSKNLAERIRFNNRAWDDFLVQEKFSLQKNSKSNYNFTQYSVSSLFEMQYHELFKNTGRFSQQDEIDNIKSFSSNPFIRFLLSMGYSINNFSDFDFETAKSITSYSMFFTKNPLLPNNYFDYTFFRKNIQLMRSGFFRKILAPKLFKKRDKDLMLRDAFLQRLKNTDNSKPRFFYLHEYLVHFPFIYNPDGSLLDFNKYYQNGVTLDSAYTRCVQYANHVNMQLIKTIKQHSRNPVIIFLGDHGYRNTPASQPENYFDNQNAVYFPNGDYSRLYDSITIVNMMRVVANKYFSANMPMLKDSSILIGPKK